MSTATTSRPDTAAAVANFIAFLESGVAPEGLFAPGMFADVTLPQWRVQADSAQGLLAIRKEGHPFPGQVRVERVEQTTYGFTIEFEERWNDQGQQWYAREMGRADVEGGRIVELAIYCTGDWDEAQQREHANAVKNLRP